MPHAGFADQQDLLRWADTLASRSELPRLVRRLILETGVGIGQIGFPAGEGVGSGGWDGTVRAAEATAFIPAGLSLWELSVEGSVGTKANSDYGKRTSTPDGSATGDCTYVAGSLRRWTKRSDWARDRTSEKRWKQVRALGVDDFETWLEDAPVTHAWISDRLGLGPHGLIAAESWWQTWSAATTPTLPAKLVLAGREDQQKELLDRLAGKPQVTTVMGDSVQEVQAFVSAVAIQLEEQGEGQLLARTAFVDDVPTWRSLAGRSNPLVLIPLNEVVSEARTSPTHHVVVPVIGGTSADIELPAIDASEATAQLRAAGVEDERRADSAGRLARRSLLALRRHLANKPELDRPPWATPPIDRVIRGILLAGKWDDEAAGDQEALTALTGLEYEDLRERLASLAAEEDPLVARVDRSWALVSPYDAWLQLRASLREDDLKRLAKVARAALLETDPALELAPDRRWRAAIDGKVRAHSGHLRHGLAQTLALLGVHGEAILAGGGSTGENWAGYLVRELLAAANDDKSCQIWAALSDHLPLLGEAAPDKFVDAVRAGVQGEDPLLAGLFTDHEDGGILGPSPAHTGLLWALEGVAWSAEHFGQAVDLLARLSEIDPGGRWANRPFNSLADIFCPWHPENAVDVGRRLSVIDGLRKRHGDVAWRLALRLLPELHGVHSPTHAPQFRDWKPPRVAVKKTEYRDFVHALVERLIEEAGTAPKRWPELLEASTNLPPDDRGTVRATLTKQISDDTLDSVGRRELWGSLRDLIAKHREFAYTDWSLPEAEVVELDTIAGTLEPDDAASRVAWLFSEHMPNLGDGPERKDDFGAYTKALEERRRDAVAEVEKAEGLDGVRRLAEDAAVPWFVGMALGGACSAQHENDLLVLLEDAPGSAGAGFARGYFIQRFSEGGWEWLDELLSREPPLSPAQEALLLLYSGDLPKAWEIADARGAEIAEAYWKGFSPMGLGPDFPHVAAVAERLIGAGRHAGALHMISLYSRDEPDDADRLAELAADGLDAMLKEGVTETEGLSQYDFETLFAYLEAHQEAVGWERVARLEWAYLGVLGYDANVPTLNRSLSTDPDAFVQVLTAVYPPKTGEDPPQQSEEQQRIASNAYRLLSSWNVVPGVGEDGKLDGAVLRTWVTEVLERLEKDGRRAIGEDQIARVLVHAPPDPEGRLINEEIRDLIEEVQSAAFEEGLRVEYYNQRGVTSRDPEAGGQQELDLAQKYRDEAKEMADQWPRTAALLREMAKSYEHDARRWENEAEQRRRGLDL